MCGIPQSVSSLTDGLLDTGQTRSPLGTNIPEHLANVTTLIGAKADVYVTELVN